MPENVLHLVSCTVGILNGRKEVGLPYGMGFGHHLKSGQSDHLKTDQITAILRTNQIAAILDAFALVLSVLDWYCLLCSRPIIQKPYHLHTALQKVQILYSSGFQMVRFQIPTVYQNKQ